MSKKINYSILLIAVALLVYSCDSKNKLANDASKDSATTDTTIQTQKEESADAKPSMALTKIKFTEDSFDFGKIDEGKKVDHIFKFTNAGENPLVLQEAVPSCGCTIPEFTKDTIAPGKEGQIKVTYNSTGRKGQINKSVTVIANTDPKNTELKISAFVIEKSAGPYNKQ